ncbi:hypothetical protein BGZ96_005628, partial [Linnemannia gamsii]
TKETADTSLEETAESFIKDTATPSIKEEGSRDKNKHSAGKKILKTEIGEQNVKVKSEKLPQPTLPAAITNQIRQSRNLNTPSSQKTAQEYPWMNMVFDTANEAKEWSDGKIFVARFDRSRLERGLNKKFEYGGVDAAFQKAKEETRKTTLKLSGFSEAADMLKLLQDKAEEDPG